MSDFTRLQQTLAKLRRRERSPGEGRFLRGDGEEELLASLLKEIDETILPRRLIFSSESGLSFQLAVANRRLQALLSPAPEIADMPLIDIVDQPLGEADDAPVNSLKEAFLKGLQSAGAVTIQSRRQGVASFGSDVGVPATILMRNWELSEPESEQLNPKELLEKYLLWLGDRAISWLRIEGEEVTDQAGPAERLEALGEQAALFLDSYFSKFDELYPGDVVGPFVTALASGSADDGEGILFVEIAELSAFVVVKQSALAEAVAHWQLGIVD